jgi:DNA-binding transcriptional MerR regulator
VSPTYKLEELAEHAGVSPRTVRYYVQRGLLPAPEFRGKDTAYGRDHLLRLNAIKHLQRAHLPLEEIQARLTNATEVELLKLVRAEAEVAVRLPFEEPRDSGNGKNRRHPYRSSGRDEAASEGRPRPLPDSDPSDATATAHVYRLATGVELWVRGGSPAASRALVREILDRYATTHDEKDADR